MYKRGVREDGNSPHAKGDGLFAQIHRNEHLGRVRLVAIDCIRKGETVITSQLRPTTQTSHPAQDQEAEARRNKTYLK